MLFKQKYQFLQSFKYFTFSFDIAVSNKTKSQLHFPKYYFNNFVYSETYATNEQREFVMKL
ncbi:hypothetical protein T05_9427 [Trichinella murrelli]|uniref:Uncharacterized protein n=1 Tax=Trichinella murrelli TaxID=144512 RepID=A0A0V0U9F5_9BILA|nr:hypothetical protein T05_9427 [Trichinella murrelli]